MAFNLKSAIFNFLAILAISNIDEIYGKSKCDNVDLGFNDLTHRTDATLVGSVQGKIADAVFTDPNSFGFNFNIECVYQNKEGQNILPTLKATETIYGGGSRGMGSSDCHNVSISVGQRMLIFVTKQNDGKLVAMYVAYDADAMLEEVVIYCYLENKLTEGVLGDTCDPVATKAEGCTDFEGSNEGIVITNKPKPRPTTLAPTPKPEPEKTTAKPDPGYTVKDKDNGNGNKNPVNPGTKGGQTVDDGNGARSTSFSMSLGLISLLSFCLVFF